MKEITTVAETTADGSATLSRPDIDEHYHSVKGAAAESSHVYIDTALRHRAALSSGEPLRVLEIGFGTGLNAALSVDAVANPIHYISLELHPLPAEIVSRLNYSAIAPAIKSVAAAPWDCPTEIKPGFILEKRIADFLTTDLPEDIDAVYFDAFAPEKQPEMWDAENFRRIYAAMRPAGVLSTYCAKGAIRRMIAEIGFFVERLPGPVGGKREILRSTKRL